MIRLSLGPCSMFVVTPCSAASSCATVTAGLPGPTILRTRGIDALPERGRGDAARAVDAPDLAQTRAARRCRGRRDRHDRSSVAAGTARRRAARPRRPAGHAEVRHDRRERALAARHVERGRGDRPRALADDHAGRDLLAPVGVAQHALVVGAQGGDHAVERVAQLGRERRARPVELGCPARAGRPARASTPSKRCSAAHSAPSPAAATSS